VPPLASDVARQFPACAQPRYTSMLRRTRLFDYILKCGLSIVFNCHSEYHEDPCPDRNTALPAQNGELNCTAVV